MEVSTQSYKVAHPFTIYMYLYKFIFLLIIPLLQNLLFQPKNLGEIIATMGFNILFVGTIIFMAVMEYKDIRFRCGADDFYFKHGWLIKRRSKISYNAIQSVITQTNVFPSIFGAVRLHINTPTVQKTNGNVTMWLSKKKVQWVVTSVYNMTEKVVAMYKSAPYHILIMAVTWSNSFAGLLVLAPFISKTGKILGKQYGEKLYESMNLSSYFVAIGVPPVTAYFAGVLVLGFVVAVVVQIFRYGNFTVTKKENIFVIDRGIINKTRYIVSTEKINSYEIKQSLLMILFKLRSVYIHTIGSGRAKGDRSLLIAAQSKKRTVQILSTFTNISTTYIKQVKSPKNKLKSYLYLPIYTLFGVLIGSGVLYYVGFNKELLNVCLLLAIPVVIIWGAFRAIAHKKAALAYNEKALIISSYKKMNLTSAIIPFEKVQYLLIKQSIFQQFSGYCNVKVYIYSEHKESFTVKHLKIKETTEISKEINKAIYDKA